MKKGFLMSTVETSREARIAAHSERVASEIPAKEKSKSRKPVTKDEIKAAIAKKKQEMELLTFKMAVGDNKDLLNALSNYERASKKVERLTDSLSIESLDDIKEDATETLDFLYERRDALEARIAIHEAAASGDKDAQASNCCSPSASSLRGCR